MTVPKALSEAGLLSTAEVAETLRVHRSTVWVWIKSDLLKHERVGPAGNFIGISKKNLDDFVKRYPVHVSQGALAAVMKRVGDAQRAKKAAAKEQVSQQSGKKRRKEKIT